MDCLRTVTVASLIRIGYWRSEQALHWPDPRSMVDSEWNDDDRMETASYLKRGFVARSYLGLSMCRICDRPVGSLELSDGRYLWPEGLAHYVDEHSVRLPEQFERHMRERTVELEESPVDEMWWRNVANSS